MSTLLSYIAKGLARRSGRNALFLFSILLSSAAQASTLSLQESPQYQVTVSMSCSFHCQLYRKSGSSWVHLRSEYSGTFSYTYDFGYGTHELKLDTYSYTTSGYMLTETDTASITINQPAPEPQPSGVTSYEYDAMGRVIKVIRDSKTTSYEYDDANNRKKKTIN